MQRLDPIFRTLAPGAGTAAATPGRARGNSTAELGYLHCGASGAGHFVKMVHNGIEYGLMAAYAEGFGILQNADIGLRQHAIDAETTPLRHPEHYVISSWLLDLSAAALAGDAGLTKFAGRVSDSGEGR